MINQERKRLIQNNKRERGEQQKKISESDLTPQMSHLSPEKGVFGFSFFFGQRVSFENKKE